MAFSMHGFVSERMLTDVFSFKKENEWITYFTPLVYIVWGNNQLSIFFFSECSSKSIGFFFGSK